MRDKRVVADCRIKKDEEQIYLCDEDPKLPSNFRENKKKMTNDSTHAKSNEGQMCRY